MKRNGSGPAPVPQGNGRSDTRYVFQIDADPERAVIRVLDSRTSTVLREIPVSEFLAFARKHKNVKRFLLGMQR